MPTGVFAGGRPGSGHGEQVWITATATVETHFIFNPSGITVVHYLVGLSLLILYEYGKELNVCLQFDKHST